MKEPDRLKGVRHEQEVLINTLSTAMLELDEAGEKEFSDQVGKVISGTSKNHESLKETIHQYELEINRIRNESD